MNFRSNRLSFLSSALLSIASCSLIGSTAHAQTIFTSTIAPTPGANDVYDLNYATTGFDGSRDFTDNPTPGQQFTPTTTGSITTITVKGVGNAGGFNTGTWDLRLSTVLGTTLTGSTTYSFSATPTSNSVDASGTANAGYLTFDLPTSFAVTAGTTYAYDMYSDNGYFGLARDTSSATGGAFNTTTARAFTSTTITPYSPTNVTRTFIAGITAPTGIVTSSSAPTVTSATVAQTASAKPFNGGTDFTDNPTPGQSFTTGANASGYKLNSLTVLGVGNAGNNYNTGLWHVRISSYSGTTLTPIGVYAFDASTLGTTNISSYLTFNLPNLNLAANTSYSYDISADNGFYGFASSLTSSATTVGNVGSYFNTGVARSADSVAATVTTGSDRTFYANLTANSGAAPEPSSAALLGGMIGTFGLGWVRRQRSRG